MKAFIYTMNLVAFGVFLYSVCRVADEAPRIYLITLVLSTIALTLNFINHVEGE